MAHGILQAERAPVRSVRSSSNPINYETFYPSSTLMFILTDNATIVRTRLQTFLIRHDHRNHIKQLDRLRELIRGNQMKSFADLVTYCSLRNDVYRDQMYGLELIPTKLERHI